MPTIDQLIGPAAGLVFTLVALRIVWPEFLASLKAQVEAATKRGDEWKELAISEGRRGDAAEDKVRELSGVIADLLKKAKSK